MKNEILELGEELDNFLNVWNRDLKKEAGTLRNYINKIYYFTKLGFLI